MSDQHEHAGPTFQTYLYVFYALCVFTGLSFVFNEMARHEIISHMASVGGIVIVAVIKASLVVTVGRDASNVIRLHDTEVSRRHAEVRRTDTGHQLVDLASANGSFVNNQKIQLTHLHPGDHIGIGQTVLLFSGGRDEPVTEI